MKYKLPKTTKLGRSSSCDIQVSPKLTKVSRQHAEIKVHNGSMYVLYDQSRAGTLVNGQKQQQIVLHDGDRISLAGVVELQFSNGVLHSSNPNVRASPALGASQRAAPAPIPSYNSGQESLPSALYNEPVPVNEPMREYIPAHGGGLLTGYKISSPGALVAIIFFFFPWILTSCGTVDLTTSGWDLAAGFSLKYTDALGDWGAYAGMLGLQGSESVPGKPILFAILVFAFLLFPLLFFAYRRGTPHVLLDGVGMIAIGAIPLFMLLLFYISMQEQVAEYTAYGLISVETQYGFWMVVLGYIAVLVGGVFNLFEALAHSRNGPVRFR